MQIDNARHSGVFMIDTTQERPIPIDELPDRYPEHIPGRGGKPVHQITLSLWYRRGVRGVRLETMMRTAWRCGRCGSARKRSPAGGTMVTGLCPDAALASRRLQFLCWASCWPSFGYGGQDRTDYFFHGTRRGCPGYHGCAGALSDDRRNRHGPRPFRARTGRGGDHTGVDHRPMGDGSGAI